MLGDRLAHHGEQPVEDEHDVVGQARFGDRREAARVQKQYRQVALDAQGFRGGCRLATLAHWRDKTRDRDVVLRTDLAGEPHARGRVDAGQRHRFRGGRRLSKPRLISVKRASIIGSNSQSVKM